MDWVTSFEPLTWTPEQQDSSIHQERHNSTSATVPFDVTTPPSTLLLSNSRNDGTDSTTSTTDTHDVQSSSTSQEISTSSKSLHTGSETTTQFPNNTAELTSTASVDVNSTSRSDTSRSDRSPSTNRYQTTMPQIQPTTTYICYPVFPQSTLSRTTMDQTSIIVSDNRTVSTGFWLSQTTSKQNTATATSRLPTSAQTTWLSNRGSTGSGKPTVTSPMFNPNTTMTENYFGMQAKML